jgi:hypothetical protein
MQRPVLFNSQKTGFLAGIVLPVVSFLIFYLFRYRDIPLVEFLNYIYFRDVLSPLLSLNILPNLVLFFIFIRKDYLFSARGVLLATFLFAGVVFLLKILS